MPAEPYNPNDAPGQRANRRILGSFIRPADNTAYAAGDLIGPTGAVVPITFQAARSQRGSGRVFGCSCVVTPGSGNVVIANLAFDLLLFRPQTNIPFAVGAYPADNAALVISAAAFKELVAVFSFSSGSWRSPAGSLSVPGVAAFQTVPLASARAVAPFSLEDLDSANLLGVCQAQAAWTPTGVANTFDFSLDVEGN